MGTGKASGCITGVWAISRPKGATSLLTMQPKRLPSAAPALTHRAAHISPMKAHTLLHLVALELLSIDLCAAARSLVGNQVNNNDPKGMNDPSVHLYRLFSIAIAEAAVTMCTRGGDMQQWQGCARRDTCTKFTHVCSIYDFSTSSLTLEQAQCKLDCELAGSHDL